MAAPRWDPLRNDSLPPTLTPAVPPYVKLGLTGVYTAFYSLLFAFIYAQLWLVLRYGHKRLSYQSVFLFLCLLWASLRTVLFSFYFRDFVAANALGPFLFWLLYCCPVCLQFFTLTLMNLYFTQVRGARGRRPHLAGGRAQRWVREGAGGGVGWGGSRSTRGLRMGAEALVLGRLSPWYLPAGLSLRGCPPLPKRGGGGRCGLEATCESLLPARHHPMMGVGPWPSPRRTWAASSGTSQNWYRGQGGPTGGLELENFSADL